MKIIAEDGAKPIKSWCENPEDGALSQAKNLARLPFAFRHVALMPDTHLGFGMPIGGVAALVGVVSPAMVGVDIGCFVGETRRESSMAYGAWRTLTRRPGRTSQSMW